MTYLEAVNAVLRRLREDTVVSTNSTDYSKLIGDFVNQAIHECEHAWDWTKLQEVITVTTAASDDLYDFHTADTKIIYGINDTKDWVMRAIPESTHFRYEYLDTPLSDSPYYYTFRGHNGEYSQIKLYPTPTGVESIRFLVVKYTPEYEIDGTDDAEVISISSLPVVLNAYAKAVSERGEDGGIGYNEADQSYREALADAISLDASMRHRSEVDWCAV